VTAACRTLKINTDALHRPALNTINQILTEPTDEDTMRRCMASSSSISSGT
jgi:hypothetical protein